VIEPLHSLVPPSPGASMNCIERVVRNVRENPAGLAVWTEREGVTSMGDFAKLVGSAQRLLRAAGVGPGDHVLLVALPSPRVYAAMVALMGLGAVGLTIEPWMPVARVESVVAKIAPKAFVASFLGKVWGARVASVRKIPRWVSIGAVRAEGSGEIAQVGVAPDARAMITFTSGTTGTPKGIVRTHRYMEDAHVVLRRATDVGSNAPGLAVFPGVVLYELAAGRGAILVPSSWKPRDLLKISQLPSELQPETCACGPAFLRVLLGVSGFEKLRSICVGGALIDCEIVESAAQRWPEMDVRHIYGGTEVEPVALTDARAAVAQSRARGLHQLLSLGGPIDAIRAEPSTEGLWVAGKHVAPEYIDSGEEDRRAKRRDADGTLWHNMGDRIDVDAAGWWYGGRASQPAGDFALEQRIYGALGSSASFVHRGPSGEAVLVGEGVKGREADVRAKFPEIVSVREAKIRRDRRHRARIDRAESWRRS
jgi:acyl-coenzyme A synthetase/AMP-(fatty) acid ligase